MSGARQSGSDFPRDLERTRRRPGGRRRRLALLFLALGAASTMAVASAPDVPAPSRSGNTIGDMLGVSPGYWIAELSDAELEADLDLIARSGVRWVRIDFAWPNIEPNRGDMRWENQDRLVSAIGARGLKVIGLVAYTPAWARAGATSDKEPPSDPSDFARFAARVAARYAPLGVHTWEVWNEPNIERFWHPRPDPEAYGELLRTATAAIRVAAPRARIVSGGLAPARDEEDGSEISPKTFLAELLASGAIADVDAVGVHPYSYPGDPGADVRWNTFAQLPRLRELTVAAGVPKPFVLSEYGAPTGGPPGAVDEAAQEQLVRRGIELAARWRWVEELLLFNHRDHPDGRPDDRDQHFGLARSDRSPKPAYTAVVELAARRR